MKIRALIAALVLAAAASACSSSITAPATSASFDGAARHDDGPAMGSGTRTTTPPTTP
jgi:hypothetical protein